MKLAVIQTGGKQYLVKEGVKLRTEKLKGEAGESMTFDKVLLTVGGAEVSIGEPFLRNVSVAAKILRQARHDKKIIFRYHSKTRYRKKKGARQYYTEVEITKIK